MCGLGPTASVVVVLGDGREPKRGRLIRVTVWLAVCVWGGAWGVCLWVGGDFGCVNVYFCVEVKKGVIGKHARRYVYTQIVSEQESVCVCVRARHMVRVIVEVIVIMSDPKIMCVGLRDCVRTLVMHIGRFIEGGTRKQQGRKSDRGMLNRLCLPLFLHGGG